MGDAASQLLYGAPTTVSMPGYTKCPVWITISLSVMTTVSAASSAAT